MANLDTAVAVGEREGLTHPMTVILPSEQTGVFSTIGYAFNEPTAERTVHVDRFGGTVVSQYGYDDYGTLAKAVTHGIALHEGRHFGTVNMVLTTLFCLAVSHRLVHHRALDVVAPSAQGWSVPRRAPWADAGARHPGARTKPASSPPSRRRKCRPVIAKYSAAQVVGLALVVLMAVIWLAWVIRRRAAFLRRLYVPTCVIGGFAMLALGPQVLGSLTGTQGLFPPEPVRPAGAFGPRPEIVGRQPQVVQDRIGQAGRGKAHG